MYLACYEELASKLPGPPTSLILGDAYMQVQEVSHTNVEMGLEVLECTNSLAYNYNNTLVC